MSIRQKFVALLLLIGVMPMLAVSIVAYVSVSNSLLSKTTDQLNSTAIKQEQRISSFLQSRQEEVTQLANQYDLQVMLRQYLTSPTAANQTSLKTILQNNKIAVTTIQSLFLTDLKGKLLASSVDTQSQGVTGLEVPNTSSETTATVKIDPLDGFSKLYVTTFVAVNKQKTALLNVAYRTDDLVAIVQDYTGLNDTGETVVVNKSNLSLFPLRFNTDASLKASLASLDLFGAVNSAYTQAKDYREKDVLIVARPVGLSDWVVATKIDKDEALASTVLLRNGIITIVLVLSAIIISAAIFLTRLFTRPILLISRIAERIGVGDFTAHMDISRRDEIGTLATSINTMGDSLKRLVNNIDLQRQRLQIILDSTTETIFAIDEHANIILVNRAIQGLLQVAPETLIGKNMQDVFSWKHGMQSFTVDYNVNGVHTYSNLQYTDKTNTRRYVKLIVARVKDEKNAGGAHAIVTIHDETSSHELENMKTDFVSMAAHELRTPLTAVRGYLEMVQYKQKHNDQTDVDSYVRQALKNVGDLGGLINNLLDVTRIERGTLTLSMEKVDIAQELSRAVEDSRFIADDRHIVLSYVGPARDQYIAGDPIALHEIINNLLANAIKYTEPKGKVQVMFAQKGDTYTIDVKDTGIGIPEQALQYLFTKFYRVHGGLDSGSTGTGLGLFIAKSIAERHHGTITVVSKENVGSTFTLTLPIFTDERLATMQPQDDNKETIVRRKRGWITKNITR